MGARRRGLGRASERGAGSMDTDGEVATGDRGRSVIAFTSPTKVKWQ